MKVHLNISAQNSADWERVLAKGYDRPAAQPDSRFVDEAMALGELAEPLGFDGVWVPDANGDFILFDAMGAYTVSSRSAFNGYYPDSWAVIG